MTPNCENGGVGWIVEWELADSLDLMRMLAQRFANSLIKVKDYFTVE